MNAVEIDQRRIGPGDPCFIIAEAGVNHNGKVEMAFQLVDAAIEAGADAVKFQTFKADLLVGEKAPKARYQERAGGKETQLEMLRRLELPFDAFRDLGAYCRKKNTVFLSTPFDGESADFLDDLGVPAFKIGSGEITNWPFLEHVAKKKKPVLLSTGMSTLREVEDAVRVIRAAGCDQLVLLHCVSNYPADPADANLRAMETLARTFETPVGYSDHTPGTEVALAAVALGASVIEKHFTLDRSLPGPDHGASLEPGELAVLVRGIRKVESALGHGRKEPGPGESEIASVARRSLVAVEDIRAGMILSEQDIAIKRPGTGLAPSYRSRLVGRRAKEDIPAGTLIRLEMLE